jgi:hypothetical protein
VKSEKRGVVRQVAWRAALAVLAGAALPSGAVYRSLGETLESGVLTVEFEAVE